MNILLLFLFAWSEEDTVVVLLTILVFFVLFIFFLIWLIFYILKKKRMSILQENNLIKNNKNFSDDEETDLNTLDNSYDKTTILNPKTDFDHEDYKNKKAIDDQTDDDLFDPIEKFKTEVIKLKERLDKEKSDE